MKKEIAIYVMILVLHDENWILDLGLPSISQSTASRKFKVRKWAPGRVCGPLSPFATRRWPGSGATAPSGG